MGSAEYSSKLEKICRYVVHNQVGRDLKNRLRRPTPAHVFNPEEIIFCPQRLSGKGYGVFFRWK